MRMLTFMAGVFTLPASLKRTRPVLGWLSELSVFFSPLRRTTSANSWASHSFPSTSARLSPPLSVEKFSMVAKAR